MPINFQIFSSATEKLYPSYCTCTDDLGLPASGCCATNRAALFGEDPGTQPGRRRFDQREYAAREIAQAADEVGLVTRDSGRRAAGEIAVLAEDCSRVGR